MINVNLSEFIFMKWCC